ncbi:MAG: hypothetical protein DBY17_04330 [Oscillospiraceae bacterium]|nr:MAG: hypothetical protein DBY17_04330 [Oscillospiraceae bacterium]
MKVYNKKTFAFGVFSTALGVLNAVTAALRGADAGDIVLIACLMFFGIGALLRGASQRLAREDRLEELDERNRLVELKSKSAALRLTQAVCFGLMLALLVAGKVSGTQALIAIGVGLAFALSISMLAELGAYFYCEKRN